MKVEVLRDVVSFSKIRRNWNEAVSKSPSDTVFLTHEWLSAWWKCFGGRSELLVVIVWDGGDIIACAPLMIKKIVMGKFTLFRKLQFITSEYSDYLDFVINKEHKKCFDLIIREIDKSRNMWDFAEFCYIPDDSYCISFWSGVKNHICIVKPSETSVFIELSPYNDWNGYLSSINKKVRFDVNRQTRNIEKLGKLKLEIFNNDKSIQEKLPVLFDMHIKKWMSESKSSQFIDTKWKGWLMDTIKELDGLGCLELSTLTINDKTIAMHYGFKYGNIYYWYMPTYDINFNRYSPGKILLAETIKDCIARKIKVVDLLRGNEKYKYYWTDKKKRLNTILLIKRGGVYRIKYYIFEILRRISQNGYIAKIKSMIRQQ